MKVNNHIISVHSDDINLTPNFIERHIATDIDDAKMKALKLGRGIYTFATSDIVKVGLAMLPVAYYGAGKIFPKIDNVPTYWQVNNDRGLVDAVVVNNGILEVGFDYFNPNSLEAPWISCFHLTSE
jgi:hypothetical protein